MRPRILYELSRRLAILLEEGMRGDPGSPRVPVFLCHPLDPVDAGEETGAHTAGILYPVGISPEARYRQQGYTLETALERGAREGLRRKSLWVRVRYLFLVAGGSMEVQLEALAAALRTLHDHPTVDLQPILADTDSQAPPEAGEHGSFPLTIIDAPEGWRELGLQDHRVTIGFEVAAPIASGVLEPVERVLERAVRLDEGSP